jgi:hypothetical protein
LKPFPSPQMNATTAPSLECDVLAFGSVGLTPQELQQLRPNFKAPEGIKLPQGFFKHASEQTIAALAAVFQAMTRQGLAANTFEDWYVLGAPRFIGRAAMAGALTKFKIEGAWGVSPHLIPHRSLHSISGAISQALKIHGPNFGIGGGCSSAEEGLLTAATLVDASRPTGVWIVMTGWDPEPEITTPNIEQNIACNALALALVPIRADFQGWRLRITRPGAFGYSTEQVNNQRVSEPLSLEQVQWALAAMSQGKFMAGWPLLNRGYLTLEQILPSSVKNGWARGPHSNGTNGTGKTLEIGTEAKS